MAEPSRKPELFDLKPDVYPSKTPSSASRLCPMEPAVSVRKMLLHTLFLRTNHQSLLTAYHGLGATGVQRWTCSPFCLEAESGWRYREPKNVSRSDPGGYVQKMVHTVGLEEVKGERERGRWSLEGQGYIKDFLEEGAFSWARMRRVWRFIFQAAPCARVECRGEKE